MNGEGEQTLRQRKHAATALNIERNAVALVLEHGLDNVTVDMICDASGVSQRTFFNYFKSKDLAILGGTPPKLDEATVRTFLTSDGPNLLDDLLVLLRGLAPGSAADVELVSRRMQIIGQSPSLFQKEMQRMLSVRDEMEDILFLRMRRSAASAESDADVREQAALITHVMAGIVRFSFEQSLAAPDGTAPLPPAKIAALLTDALARLLAP
jgi:AcrR family transcriptional regulator